MSIRSLALDADQLRLEDEGGVGGDDATGAAGTVAELGGDGELALLANLHAEEALVPALDDLAGTDGEVQRVTAVVARVELVTVRQRALVVDIDVVACRGSATVVSYSGGATSWELHSGTAALPEAG